MITIQTVGEKSKTTQLSIIDPETGIDFINDFIGNHGGFSEFTYVEDDDIYYCTEFTYDWWVKVVKDNQDLVDRIHALNRIYGSYEVQEKLLEQENHVDLEDHAKVYNNLLDELEESFNPDYNYNK